MVRTLARLLGLVIGASVVAGIAGSLAALKFRKTAPPLPDPAADEIDLVAVMSGAQLASTAVSFRGGRVICWYAGVDLDLREATFDPAGADLEVRTVFGGTRVVVAPGVPVTASGPAVFGGRVTERNDHRGRRGPPGPPDHRLHALRRPPGRGRGARRGDPGLGARVGGRAGGGARARARVRARVGDRAGGGARAGVSIDSAAPVRAP